MTEYCYILNKLTTKAGMEFLSPHMNEVAANSVYKSKHHALAAYSSHCDEERYEQETLFFEMFIVPDFKLKK